MATPEQAGRNRRTMRKLLLAAVCMFGFGYALVPMYGVICRITGLHGKTVEENEAQATRKGVDMSRLITVEFTTSTYAGLPWDFQPLVHKVQVHPGAVTQVEFKVRNQADRPVTGQAVPSLAPGEVARYFKKTECFCFSRQIVEAKQEKIMPLRFVVDPALPRTVSTVTLSYTFFEVPDDAVANAWEDTAAGVQGS